MSLKARRLSSPARPSAAHAAPSVLAITEYPWGDSGPGRADHAGRAPEPAAESKVAPAPPDDLVLHQARLASLEREAFATGYAQGERAGLEAGNTRAEAMLRRLAETLDELTSLRTTIVRQAERQMVDLALAIAHRILRRESTLDGDLIVAMARVALERLGEAGGATIRLNPDDYSQVAQRHGESWAGSKVRVLADASVSRGGCLVDSEFGSVDAGVEAQFDQVMRALIGDQTDAKYVEYPAA